MKIDLDKIINFNNKKWLIKYETDEPLTEEKIKWFKWYKGADIVLRNKNTFYFVQEIIDANYESIT